MDNSPALSELQSRYDRPRVLATLKDRRNAYENRVLLRLKEVLPEGIGVTIVADWGFRDQKLYHLLEHELYFTM